MHYTYQQPYTLCRPRLPRAKNIFVGDTYVVSGDTGLNLVIAAALLPGGRVQVTSLSVDGIDTYSLMLNNFWET